MSSEMLIENYGNSETSDNVIGNAEIQLFRVIKRI